MAMDGPLEGDGAVVVDVDDEGSGALDWVFSSRRSSLTVEVRSLIWLEYVDSWCRSVSCRVMLLSRSRSSSLVRDSRRCMRSVVLFVSELWDEESLSLVIG